MFFYMILPSQTQLHIVRNKSGGGGVVGVLTTFPNSAKPSQTLKNDAFQGQLYEKLGGYTCTTSSLKVIQISSSWDDILNKKSDCATSHRLYNIERLRVKKNHAPRQNQASLFFFCKHGGVQGQSNTST